MPRPGCIVDDDLQVRLMKHARQIAEGMTYLARRQFIHRVSKFNAVLKSMGLV